MTHLTSRLIRNSGPIKKPDVVELGIRPGLLEHCQRMCLPDTPSEKFPPGQGQVVIGDHSSPGRRQPGLMQEMSTAGHGSLSTVSVENAHSRGSDVNLVGLDRKAQA